MPDVVNQTKKEETKSTASQETNKVERTIWFVAHDSITYCQHDDMIRDVLKKKDRFSKILRKKESELPSSCAESSDFSKIGYNDLIVYYVPSHGVIVGIFKKAPDKEAKIKSYPYLYDDTYWSDCLVHCIEPFIKPKDGYYLDFKKIIADNPSVFSGELLEYVADLEAYDFKDVQKICIALTEEQYSVIEDTLSNPNYLVCYKEAGKSGKFATSQVDPDVLSALLDFHNSRATSFVNLCVASVFGIVTLSAISQSMFYKIEPNVNLWYLYTQVLLTLILYSIFAFAGGYTLRKYFYYADVASKIKAGLDFAYFEQLNKLLVSIRVKDKARAIGLANFLQRRAQAEEGNILTGIVHLWNHTLELVYFYAIIGLAAVVYWSPITEPIINWSLKPIEHIVITIAILALPVIAVVVMHCFEESKFKKKKNKTTKSTT